MAGAEWARDGDRPQHLIYPVVDVDSDDILHAMRMREITESICGKTPVIRRRDEAVRMGLFYKHKPNTAPFTKLRSVGEDEIGQRHLCEILARNNYIVIEGPHKTGRMHY